MRARTEAEREEATVAVATRRSAEELADRIRVLARQLRGQETTTMADRVMARREAVEVGDSRTSSNTGQRATMEVTKELLLPTTSRTQDHRLPMLVQL